MICIIVCCSLFILFHISIKNQTMFCRSVSSPSNWYTENNKSMIYLFVISKIYHESYDWHFICIIHWFIQWIFSSQWLIERWSYVFYAVHNNDERLFNNSINNIKFVLVKNSFEWFNRCFWSYLIMATFL